jgi:hypothetical protein
MIDGTHDYSRHPDDELRDRIESLAFAEQPRNAKALAQELNRRWSESARIAAAQSTTAAIERGAQFSELDPPTARAFFWRYFRYMVLLSLVYGAALFCVIVLVSILDAVVTRIATGNAIGGLSSPVISLIASLILMIPFSKFYLRRMTRKAFGEYGLRIVRVAEALPSNKSMEPTRDP